jgi:hypothetical protein
MSRSRAGAAPFLSWCLAASLLSACLFETRSQSGGLPPEEAALRPDLSIGGQWLYVSRQYLEYRDGAKSDTTDVRIHYGITGDSVIGGTSYRILVEEELALFNTDEGLRRYRSVYAVRSDPTVLEVKALKDGRSGTGHLPFKIAAPARATSSAVDTAHFRDETVSLRWPLIAGNGWSYREPGNAFGILPARKTFLGKDSILSNGESTAALKFSIQVEGRDDIRAYEWYVDGLKVLSRSSYSLTFGGEDSVRAEEEFLGARYFTRSDTDAVLKGSIFESVTE